MKISAPSSRRQLPFVRTPRRWLAPLGVVVMAVCTSVSTSSSAAPEPRVSSSSTAVPSAGQGLERQQAERANASNTGVPEGTRLRASGSRTITKDGSVLDGLHVRGSITIEADNVTIRNSLIQSDTSAYPIRVSNGSNGTLIEDVEVDNQGGTGIGIYFSSGSGTVRRADIHSAEDGIRIETSNVKIKRSYVHDLQRYEGGHHDTIQIRSGDNITLRGNTLLAYVKSTDDPMNAALQIGSLAGTDQISNLKVIGNYMNGGNFTVNGGGRDEVDSALYSRNRFGRDFRYAVRGNLDNSTWDATNVYDDTGRPAR